MGSLARPWPLLETLREKEHGRAYDQSLLDRQVRDAVAGVIRRQVESGLHQHEWHVWESVQLPEGKALIPGFLSHAQNYVEHPELIADGIVQYARPVARERVLAGADCGFSSRASFAPEMHPRGGSATRPAQVHDVRERL